MKKYRVAVIGRTGKGNYGHGLDTVWMNHPRAEIVGVADEDEKGRLAAGKRLKTDQIFADFKEMLAKTKPEIVSVADRFLDMHRDMVLACAEHGASIFLEKPISRTLQEADEMVAACEKHHVKCAIAHQTRYSPRVAIVKKMIQDGLLGDLLELRGRGKEDPRGGGQDMMVLGTHTFDLMRFLAGDAQWCMARIFQGGKLAVSGDVRMGGEGMGPIQGDRIAATYGMANAHSATFGTYVTKDFPGKRYSLHVYGSKGVVQLNFGAHGGTWFLPDPSWMPGQSKTAWQEITSAGIGKPETLKETGVETGNHYIVDDLIESIEKDRQPLGNIYDGRAALEMIMAVYESHKLQKPVELPMKNRRHPLG
ncbi:Gfo/Idh/MocA family protein [Zavarzinella formosa]|uniref:Gfo/Idh/MocA family protein n=1 Tax=Zavarzinella formosa TaxID=360055 RepID=UPI0002E1FFC7|nr:Gfo/Idh/MocA family oxidoreductase [Zavarzinella formosa]